MRTKRVSSWSKGTKIDASRAAPAIADRARFADRQFSRFTAADSDLEWHRDDRARACYGRSELDRRYSSAI